MAEEPFADAVRRGNTEDHLSQAEGKGKNFPVTLRTLVRYFRSHIWLEILTSMLFMTLVLLSIFFLFLQNRYYNDVIRETEKADNAILSVTAGAMSNLFREQLHIGGEIAVNSNLYDIVHGAIKNGRLTYSDEVSLKNEISTAVAYSDAIASIALVTEEGLLYEYARYWGYDTPMLWTGENLPMLQQMYDDVIDVITEGKPGYFVTGASPLTRTELPVMTLYHIAFPLLGGYRSLEHVEAAIVVTYHMESVARSSAMIGGSTIENTYRYLTDDSGLIVFHEDAALTGMTEKEYLEKYDLQVASKPLDSVGLNLSIALDRQQIRANVSRMYMRGATVYVAGILLLFLLWQVILRSILKPVEIIKKSMESVEQGKRVRIDVQGEHEIWLLAQEYNVMLDALQSRQEMLQKEYQEKVEMSELRNQAEKIALESQINAHFIFNTLNAINYNAIETGSIETSHLIKRLSNLLQYTLSSQSEVTVGRELDMAVEYLYLQKYRLMDKFEYDISFAEEYSEWPCCKLFLQPFVENSIVHGFENTESGGRIWISGKAEGERFRVEIGDNGCGMDDAMKAYIMTALEGSRELSLSGSGIAIRNVLKRMRMFYGSNFDVKLTSAPGEGTVFVFYLPIPPEADEEENRG